MRLACERHLEDRRLAARVKGHPRGWRFSEQRANHCIGFYERVLCLPMGQPFILQPMQVFVIGSLMGWVGTGDDGQEVRRFREAYIETGKGSGKTPLAAGLGLYGLIMDGEPEAEIYAAAKDRVQARIMFTDAERLIASSPELQKMADDGRIGKVSNSISYRPGHAFFRPYSREEGLKSGPRPHFALTDEIHEHRSGEIYGKLLAGFKQRPQPLMLAITNSGYDRTSICWQLHDHGDKVLSGLLEDDSFFAYICQLDEGDDPLEDETCWIKTNPLLGVTPSVAYLRRQAKQARDVPGLHNLNLRLNWCVWTRQADRAINMVRWAECPQAPVPADQLVGAPCYAGLDLGQSDDFTAFVVIWVLSDGRVAVQSRFWIPGAALESHPSRPYDQWRRGGHLEVTPGNITDYDVVEQHVATACRSFGVRELAYDKRFAEQMAQHLQGQGVTMVDTPQGFQLNEACRRLDELIAAARLCHGNQPVLSWMAGNLVWRSGPELKVRPDKDAPGEKMDGAVALIMALSREIAQQTPVTPYADRGVLTV